MSPVADQADALRVRGFPQQEGLPGRNAVSKQEAQEGEEDEPPWTVALNGMDVKFNVSRGQESVALSDYSFADERLKKIELVLS